LRDLSEEYQVNRIVKRVLFGVLAVVGLVVVGGGAFVGYQVMRFDSSMNKVYDLPVKPLERSTDEAVLARGQHLSEAIVACVNADCHGPDLGGGKTLEFGPLGKVTGPNISAGGLGAAYSDGELVRLIRHGVKKDGRSVRFMPSHEINWLPDADLAAVISYLRTLPPSNKPNGPTELGLMAKIVDRLDLISLDVARHIDHANIEIAPPPAPTAAYGRFVVRGCTGCHGERLSGGPIPAAPPELPVPLNLTPHETGLKGWTYEDFDRLLTTGMRKNGKKLDPFMPISAYVKMDETEKKALWAHLSSLEPLPFGGR
jgi:mono/diheme cytochrome c family protein